MDPKKLLDWGMEVIRKGAERKGARLRFVDVGPLRMHFFEVPGKVVGGPTVVLIHGLGGSSVGYWRVMFRLASHAGRVVVPDFPGSGFSPLPASGPLGFAEVMDVLDKFTDLVVPERAIYLGNSLGGAMAARFAARNPKKVSGLVLVSPAGGRVESHRMQELLDGFQVQTQQEARALSRRFFSRPPLVLPFLMGPTLLPLMARPSVRKLLEEAIRVSALEDSELEGMEPPVLLLWAKNERVLPYEGLEHWRAHLPKTAQIEEVEDFGHSPQLDRPKELVEWIARFARERVGASNSAA
ncbi:MAG TPA: alpha/beta hydrolase [Myxococcales bacterium]|jgi:pimeloyl-ACP methyl ester carboxylesterase